MPQRKDPDIPVVTALVITPWPGMDAERIEDRVTRRIEAVVAENKHVETVRSVSRTNVSYVYVELKEGMTETGEVFDDIGLRLNGIRDLPEGAGPIQFIKDFGSTAALMLTVASPRLEEVQVSLRADQVRAAIEQLRAGAAPGHAGHGGVQLPALDLRGQRGPAGSALPGAGGGGRHPARRPAARGPAVRRGGRDHAISPTRRSSPTCTASSRSGFGPPSSTPTPGSRPSCATRRRPGRRLLAVAGDKYSYQELEQLHRRA